jgi:LPXTG-motif cell wall-anchored protein
MSKSLKGLMLVALAAMFVMAFGAMAFAQTAGVTGTSTGVDMGPGLGAANNATGGGLEAAAVGEMGNTQFDEASAVPVLDLPALGVERDAQGRIRMDLPGLTLYGPGKAAPVVPGGPGRLPTTGVNVGDIAAMGMAALSGGAVFLRRLRLSFAR